MASSLILPGEIDPISAIIDTANDKPVLPVPDIMEFVFSDQYLNRQDLYPRQGTVLKSIFLQDTLFTSYDYSVIEEWSQGFHLPNHAGTDGALRYEGTWGCQPDLLERIRICKAQGRKWFRENVIVLGRRGSKGYIGGICAAYVLWNYLAWGNPQNHYGVDRDKQLTAVVFAGKMAQARDEQWRDIVNVILGAPIFAKHISRSMGESLTVRAPSDETRDADRQRRGIKSAQESATFKIVPKESTKMAGRGPTSFMQFYDEMAHIVATGANRDASEIYGASTPALDQFKEDAFLYEASSPWAMNGQFYENWQNSLEVHHETHVPVRPEMFMLQLESWDIYKDWRRSTEVKVRKGWKRTFPKKNMAMQEYDDEMRKLEEANPETFAVERRARWASALNAYLNPERIREMFEPWNGRTFRMESRGRLNYHYVAHGDPSSVNANFGFAIAHLEGPDENGFMHVVFDLLHHWAPGTFVDNDYQIDYMEVEKWIETKCIEAFMPEELSFDQFNSIMVIQRLRDYVAHRQLPKRINIYERTATKAKNWEMAETFKAALNMRLLHCFSGDTKYWTWDGLRTLSETVGTTQRVLTQTGEWVDADIRAGGIRSVMRLVLERNGVKKEVLATPDHRWLVKPPGHPQVLAKCKVVQTADLQAGSYLASMKPRPRTTRVQPSPYGIAHGIVFGDGARIYKGTHVTLWGEKDLQLLRYFPSDCRQAPRKLDSGVKGLNVSNLPRFFKEPPDLDESPGYLYGWLAGYFAADGTVGKTGQVVLASHNKKNLELVQHIAMRLGIATYGIGEQQHSGGYDSEGPGYALTFARHTLKEDFFLIANHRERFSRGRGDRLSWRVVSVDDVDIEIPVFCAVVPETESFVLDGLILTKNSAYYEQADLEMRFLQDMGNERVDKSSTGAIQTKDVWDAMANVTYSLIGEQMAAFLGRQFSEANVRGALQGGQRPFPAMDGDRVSDMFSSFSRGMSTRQRAELSRADPSRSLGRATGFRPSSPWGKRGR